MFASFKRFDMSFVKDKLYTRQEIQQLVGGEIQTYLPQSNKIILAGCFSRELNPDAPNEIQAGNAHRVSAKAYLLSQQPETIFPVFLKEKKKDKHYSYIGRYKYMENSITHDTNKICEAEEKSGRHGELSYLFKLTEVD